MAAVVIAQGLLGPQDGSDHAYERTGMLDLTTPPFRAPASIAAAGIPTIVYFVRDSREAATTSSAHAAASAFRAEAQVRIVVAGPTVHTGAAEPPGSPSRPDT